MLASSTSLPRKDPMRRIPLIRTGAATITLSLLVASAVGAQEELREPQEGISNLQSAVVTSALDPVSVNQTVVDTARTVHEEMGGRVTTNKNNGWWVRGPARDTAAVSEEILTLTRNEVPTNIITVMGGDNQRNVDIARNFPDSWIVDVGQTLPCVTETGAPDPSGACPGGAFAIPPRYSALEFAVEDGAYLAGVLAAKGTSGQGLGVISGYADCTECRRYVAGFLNGARSVDPEIDIEVAYLSSDQAGAEGSGEASGFSDPETARTFARAFIDVYQPAVLLAVGRGATRGMVEAACDAGIKAIGTGIDVRALYPELDCTLASVVPDVERALRDRLIGLSYNESAPVTTYGLSNAGVIVTDEWVGDPSLRVDTEETYRAREAALLSGDLEACDETCGLGPAVTPVE
jgi:basic membrane lipoprotein Med (substrate-binding protein (PBP1-ABC) superfamily)